MSAKRRILLFLVLCLLLTSCAKDPKEASLEIFVLDVGQGDSILLRSPWGNVLIDSGTEQSQSTLCLRLEQLGVTEITLAIFTHPDEDHIGGADGVLENIPVREVWTNGAASEEACYASLMQALSKSNATHTVVRAGDAREIGELSIFVLAPLSVAAEGNEGSIVLRLQIGSVSAIFSGDADATTEEQILATYGASQLDCDIYKVGHHGSVTSTCVDFLEAMSPRYALISAGRANPYGHPHGQVVWRLQEAGAKVLRTDLSGELLLMTDGREIWIEDPRRK